MNKFYEAYRNRQKKEKGYFTCCSEYEFKEVLEFLVLSKSVRDTVKKWLRGYLNENIRPRRVDK